MKLARYEQAIGTTCYDVNRRLGVMPSCARERTDGKMPYFTGVVAGLPFSIT